MSKETTLQRDHFFFGGSDAFPSPFSFVWQPLLASPTKPQGISSESIGIKDERLRVSSRVVKQRFDLSGVLGVQPRQAGSLERLGEVLDTSRP